MGLISQDYRAGDGQDGVLEGTKKTLFSLLTSHNSILNCLRKQFKLFLHTMQQVEMITMRRVAQEARVSIGTVSRVLRSKDQVLPETRERVVAAANRLRYRPNLLMRGVRNRATHNIGVMVSVEDSFGGQIVAGIHDTLCEADYAPVLLWANWKKDIELQQIHRLVDRRVDGVILRPADHRVRDDYFKEIWERGIPLVTVDTELTWTHADFVGTDEEMGTRLAAEHLLALGHRRFGQLAGPRHALNSQRRRNGFEQAVAATPQTACRTLECPFFDQGIEQARQLLAAADRPTAIFCHTDWLAHAVYEVAGVLGLAIPHHLSVVGYADLNFAAWMQPPLTTVRQNPVEMGRQAAQLVLKRAGGTAFAQPGRIRLKPELIIRNSTAPHTARGPQS